jgi:EmrB/QacA subfamily drug resistance transporter
MSQASVVSPAAGNSRKRLLLLFLCLAVFMAYLDVTIVNIALPTIERQLSVNVSQLQWIVDAYALVFASLLLTSGTLGDGLGRKKIFLIGLIGFTLMSAGCGLSTSFTELLVFRTLQGSFASILMPVSLSLVAVTYQDAGERARAIGVWAGVGGVALAAGPVVGGLLVEHFGWQSIFWLNIPVGVVAVIALSRMLKETRAPQRRRIDVVGQVLFIFGVGALVYGLIEANSRGWTSHLILGCFAASILAFAAFVVWELKRSQPMLPLAMFRNPTVVVAGMVNLLGLFGIYTTIFLFTLFLQSVDRLSSVDTGLRFLALTASIMVASFFAAGRLAMRFPPRWLILLGSLMECGGLAGLLRVNIGTSYNSYWWALVLIGVGVSLAGAPATVAMLTSVPREQSGTASGISNTFRQFGSVFGVAISGAVLLARFGGTLTSRLRPLHLPPAVQAQAVALLSHGDLSRLSALPAADRGPVFAVAAPLFVGGVHVALLIATIASPLAGIAAAILLPRRRPAPAPAAAPQPAVPAAADGQGAAR